MRQDIKISISLWQKMGVMGQAMAFLTDDRYVMSGGRYNFNLEIKDSTPLVNITKIMLSLGDNSWYWNVSAQSFPFNLQNYI